MNQTFDWQERGTAYYYYNIDTGKIVGVVSKLMSNEIWIALVHVGKYTLTLDDEKHLGQYIDLNFARPGIDVRYALDDSKLRSIGWEPICDFDQEIIEIVKYYKENFVW